MPATARKGVELTHNWKTHHSLIVLLLTILYVLAGALWRWSAPSLWVLLLLLVIGLAVTAGVGVTGRILGVLISPENRMSLSRLQAFVWTVVLVSAFSAAAFWNVRVGRPRPLEIAVPRELWILAGISLTSLAGTPLIKDIKGRKPNDAKKVAAELRKGGITIQVPPDLEKKTFAELSDNQKNDALAAVAPYAVGQKATNPNIADASFGNIFEGDDAGNRSHLDLSKLQMFYFTVILVFAYCVALAAEFSRPGQMGFNALPPFSDGAIALLGISHAGYLTYKSAPHGSV